MNGGAWTALYTGAGLSASVSGPADASYQFRASACNANGCSTPTVSAAVSIAHVPPAPGSIAAPASSTGAVGLSWAGSTYATVYGLEHSADGATWVQVYVGPSTSATINEGTGSWTYRVEACNDNGCSGYATSGAVAVTVPPTDAPPISGGGTSNSGAYTISWSGVAGATSYNLMESANGGALTTVQNDGNGSWSTSGRGDGTYVYQVQGCNAGGCGPFSGQIAVTVSLIPATPARPSVTTTNPDYKPVVHVTWAAVAGATRYEVLKREESTGNTETVYTGTALTWSELTYYSGALDFSVRACNDVGCSAYSPSDTIILVSGD